LFAGDLVEAEAALYTGDAFHFDYSTTTLDHVKAFGAEQIVGGREAVARGRDACDRAIEQTREFLKSMIHYTGSVHRRGGTLKEAFLACHDVTPNLYQLRLEPRRHFRLHGQVKQGAAS
jgi:hypothetical protein